jgi:hypothetical protein
MNKMLDKILSEVALDQRVSNGMFNIEEDAHMEALRDYLTKKGIDEESVRAFSNRVLEGKYPERQAYNAKGILVTLPTPEYKKNAIKAGTHFEKDPTKGMSNLFGDAKPKPEAPSSKDKESPPEEKPSEPKTNLPVSQANAPEAGDTGAPAATPQPQTTAAPQQTPVSTPAAEPVKEPTELPLPPDKSPAEKEADKNAIKTMLKGDDYMLEETINILMEASELRPYIKDGKDFTLSIKAKRLIERITKKL